jgi:hypothetical protein
VNRSCGIDWAEGHHDVAIVDGDGKLLAKKLISDDRRIKNDPLAAVGWGRPMPRSTPIRPRALPQSPRPRRSPRRRSAALVQQDDRPALPLPTNHQTFDPIKAFGQPYPAPEPAAA